MAPRKQAKRTAAENTQAAADGNVTPPKKRKTAAKSTATAVPKQAKTAVPRQVRQVKEQEAATVFSPKNLRSRQKNVPKNDTENKMFVNKQKEAKTAIEGNDTDEQVVEKKTRGGGKSAVKKAGTKTTTAKPKVKAPVKKKEEVGDDARDIENGTVSEENPSKRTTRRGNTETKTIAEADDEPQEKNDAEMIVDNKKSREKAKKTAKTTVKKEKLKKNSTKVELALSEEMKESKPKNSKKGSVKKTISKGKRNAEMIEKNNDAQAEEAIIHKVKENRETEIEQIIESKQKKKNTKNTNVAVNGKTEAKKKQKEEQTITIKEGLEIEDVAVKKEPIAATNLTLESLNENDAKDISLDKSQDVELEKNENLHERSATFFVL